MLDVEDRLAELEELGLYRRMRMVSGPQGPRVVLDGRPVLLLCSDNHLGLADHPRVREAAADAAMRWGAGAGAARSGAGTMTLHRRLEERLAGFLGTDAALLFGSGYLATLGIIPALAERGEIVFSDALNHPSVVDGCRLSGAETFVYDHGDVEHLAWGLRNADGRAALIVTEGVFALDGDTAPLEAIVSLAHRFDVRVLVGEAHALGTIGPDGRGAVAAAGLRGQVDVITGSLGTALGAAGGFAACDRTLARYLATHARTFSCSTAVPPPAVAAAMAALELLRRAAAAGREAAGQRRRPAHRARARGLRRRGRRRAPDLDRRRRRVAGGPDRRAGARAGRLHRRRAPAGRGRGLRAAAARGDGLAHEVGAARRRADPRPSGAARRLPAPDRDAVGSSRIAARRSVG